MLKRYRGASVLVAPLIVLLNSGLAVAPAFAQTGSATEAPAPSPATAAPTAPVVSHAAFHGSLLVWPLDTARTTSTDPTLSITAANDIVGALAGRGQVRVAALKPDPYENSPAVARAVKEDTTGEFQRIISGNTPTTKEAVTVARELGYDGVLMGSVDTLTSGAGTASASISGQLIDATLPDGAILMSVHGTGTTSGASGALTAATAENMALRQAANEVASEIVPAPSVGGGTTTVHRNNLMSVLRKALPYIIGVGVVAAVVSASHGSTGQTVTPFVGPSRATIGVDQAGSGLSVGLAFAPSNGPPASVQRYDIYRTSATGTKLVVSIPAETAALDSTGRITTFDNTVTPGQSYSYYVVAVPFSGTPSQPVFFTTASGQRVITPGKPAPPTGLNFQVVGNTVVLNWTPSTDTFVQGYAVLRSSTRPTTISDAGFTVISPIVNATTFTDDSPSLVSGKTFYYKVEAVSTTNPPINSTGSNVVAVTIP